MLDPLYTIRPFINGLLEAINPMKTFSFSTAQSMHKKQWMSGKHKEWGEGEDDYFFPFSDRYKKLAKEFVLVRIPIKDLDTSAGSMDRVKKYAEIIKSGTDMGPAWGVYGRFKNDGSHVEPHTKGKISVLDGNHRTEASKKAGKTSMMVIMPDISFQKYLDQ